MGLFGWVSEVLGTKKVDQWVEQANESAAEGDYAYAEKCYARALEMAEETKNYHFIAIAAYGAAVACEKQNKNVTAEKHYTKAFRTWEDSEEWEQCAEALEELARLLRSQRRLSEAEGLHKYALKILQEKFQPDDIKVIESSRKLSQCLIEKKAFGEAEGVLTKLISQTEKSPHSPTFVPHALCDLARCYVEQGREADAEGAFARALELYDKLEDFSVDNSGVKAVGCAHEYARCLMRQNKTDPAKSIYSRALALADAHPGYLGEGELIDESSKYAC